MDSLIPEDPVITIPDHDWKIVEAIHKHYADAKALARVQSIDGDQNILDKDSADNVARIEEQEYAIAGALAEVLDARCPKCVQSYTKKERVVNATDIVEGRCSMCKTMIVRGE